MGETRVLAGEKREQATPRIAPPLVVAGLFAGIGGIELGLHEAGHQSALLCEIDPAAQAVLRAKFPRVPVHDDVRTLAGLPKVDLVAAGFPCQDLSQAGRTAGIGGQNSGLVGEVLRLVSDAGSSTRWLLLENVPFMLHLEHGRAMQYLTEALGVLGFTWAYRIVDTRAFGLPHRRQRVLLLASRTEDPRDVLLTMDAGEPPPADPQGVACGFYWTEGSRGLGWAIDAVPTLKGGSTVGIPSPPAIWTAEGRIVTPEIRDMERLQGFPADWTLPASGQKKGARWKLVGNAVSVPVARWVGQQLRHPSPYDMRGDARLSRGASWPTAAWGHGDSAFKSPVSAWPSRMPPQHLASFLQHPVNLLSARATAGFLARARASTLHFQEGFLDSVARHLEHMRLLEREFGQSAVA